MLAFGVTQRRAGGALLVLLQFGLLLWLVLMATSVLRQGGMSLSGGLLVGLSGALGAWTLWHNRLGNFRIHPEPKPHGQLVTTGPYRLIRHPMYTAVLLLAAALALVAAQVLAWLIWVALFGVLLTKARLEEDWLCEQHPLYASYRQHNKRFVPWLF